MAVKYLKYNTPEEKNTQPEKKDTRVIKKEVTQKDASANNSTEGIDFYPEKTALKNRLRTAGRLFIGVVLLIIGLTLVSYFDVLDDARAQFSNVFQKKSALIVNTEFSKADVYLDSKKLGQTPLTINAYDPGMYTLTLKVAEDSQGFFTTLDIPVQLFAENTTIVKAQVGPTSRTSSYSVIYSEPPRSNNRYPSLVVKSDPIDANVLIGNTSVGKTPYDGYNLEPGTHTVKVEKQGYRPIELEIEIKDKRTVVIDAKLYQYLLGQ